MRKKTRVSVKINIQVKMFLYFKFRGNNVRANRVQKEPSSILPVLRILQLKLKKTCDIRREWMEMRKMQLNLTNEDDGGDMTVWHDLNVTFKHQTGAVQLKRDGTSNKMDSM